MKHYDGPAFFRKYGQQKKLMEWQQATNLPRSAEQQDTKQDSSATKKTVDSFSMSAESAKPALKIKARAPKPNKYQKQTNSDVGLSQPETHVTFTPGRLANTLPTRTPSGTVNQHIFDPTLRLVMQHLRKELAAFFVLDKSQAGSATVTDTQSDTVTFMPTVTSVDSTVNSIATAVEQTSVTSQVTAEHSVTATSAQSQKTIDEATTEVPSLAKADLDSSASTSESVAESSVANAQPLIDSRLSISEAESYQDTVDHAVTDEESAKKGLGISLNDIFNEEDNAQKDLALFKKPVLNRNPDMVTQHKSTANQNESVGAPVVVSQAVEESDSATTPVSEAPKPESAEAIFKSDQELAAYHFPPLNLLTKPIVPDETEMDEWIQTKADALDQSLSAFGVNANVVDWTVGPTVTQFQVKLAQGVRVSKITNLNDDLKLALAAKDIRIEAPIPGRNTVGIEIPNQKSRPVMLAEVLDSAKFRDSSSPLTVALGVDLFGQPQVTDLRKMPHGLIAGATGSGKSVFINSILVSILYKANPQQVKLLLIDPKAVELAPYNDVPHLIAPVISEPKAASAALKWVVDEMEDRYQRLAAGGVRNIEQFNEEADKHHEPALKMPYIVIVIDELADLMMVASSEVQDYIARITQKARAAGIHLLVATQRPSVDVVTGTIKNNIPTRIAFMVASQIDSRTILDASGAERLLGRGDMLYLGNGQSQPIRLQGTFVDHEIDDITSFVKDQAAPHYEFQPDNLMKHDEAVKNQDDLLPEVLEYIAAEDTVSTSKLQRTFSVGYNRAANIIDDLENRNYVSPAKGSKPRDVYFDQNDLAAVKTNS